MRFNYNDSKFIAGLQIFEKKFNKGSFFRDV